MPRKSPKKALARVTTPRIPRVGDRVIPEGSSSVYEITRVSRDGRQVDLCLRGTDLERFRVPVDHLRFVK